MADADEMRDDVESMEVLERLRVRWRLGGAKWLDWCAFEQFLRGEMAPLDFVTSANWTFLTKTRLLTSEER